MESDELVAEMLNPKNYAEHIMSLTVSPEQYRQLEPEDRKIVDRRRSEIPEKLFGQYEQVKKLLATGLMQDRLDALRLRVEIYRELPPDAYTDKLIEQDVKEIEHLKGVVQAQENRDAIKGEIDETWGGYLDLIAFEVGITRTRKIKRWISRFLLRPLQFLFSCGFYLFWAVALLFAVAAGLFQTRGVPGGVWVVNLIALAFTMILAAVLYSALKDSRWRPLRGALSFVLSALLVGYAYAVFGGRMPSNGDYAGVILDARNQPVRIVEMTKGITEGPNLWRWESLRVYPLKAKPAAWSYASQPSDRYIVGTLSGKWQPQPKGIGMLLAEGADPDLRLKDLQDQVAKSIGEIFTSPPGGDLSEKIKAAVQGLPGNYFVLSVPQVTLVENDLRPRHREPILTRDFSRWMAGEYLKIELVVFATESVQRDRFIELAESNPELRIEDYRNKAHIKAAEILNKAVESKGDINGLDDAFMEGVMEEIRKSAGNEVVKITAAEYKVKTL